jgi:hypothetical protein
MYRFPMLFYCLGYVPGFTPAEDQRKTIIHARLISIYVSWVFNYFITYNYKIETVSFLKFLNEI